MVLMLNCSYKAKDGNSKYFLKIVEDALGNTPKNCEIIDLRNILGNSNTFNGEIPEEVRNFAERLKDAEALVIGAPLYVDALPAQIIRLMEILLEEYKGEYENLKVYAVSNLGFYEGSQIRHLFDMIRNWCSRINCTYGGAAAVGAGPMITALDGTPLQRPFNKDVFKGLEKLAEAIKNGQTMENYYCKTSIPRFVYKSAAHKMFNDTLKANGVTEKGELLDERKA